MQQLEIISVQNVLESCIQREKLSVELYDRALATVQNPASRKLLEKFRAEENDHVQRLTSALEFGRVDRLGKDEPAPKGTPRFAVEHAGPQTRLHAARDLRLRDPPRGEVVRVLRPLRRRVPRDALGRPVRPPAPRGGEPPGQAAGRAGANGAEALLVSLDPHPQAESRSPR